MTPIKRMLNGTSALSDPRLHNPIAIFSFLTTTAGLTTATAILLTAGITVGVSLVTSWALQALMPKPDYSSLQGMQVNAREPVAPHDFVYGEVRKGGIITYYETTGTNNRFLHQIIVLAGHEVDSISDIYINDEMVTLDANGFVTSDPWDSKIRIKKHRGNQVAADADLLAESNQITSSFIGTGVAYLYVRYEYDQNVFSNGLPLVTAVVKGKKVYDPRTSLTTYSSNAALCVRDYITSSYGLIDSEVDDTAFSVAANICDETVLLSDGGSEYRYSLNGVANAATSHGDVLQNMLTACAGTLFWGAGKWKLNVGHYTAPTKTLTLDDLRSSIVLETRNNLRDQFNSVQGTFNDASQRWITSDYPPVVGAGFVAEDGGEETPLDLTLPFTTSSATAQRIAKMTLYRGREQMSFSAEFGLNAFDVEVGEIVSLTMERYGWVNKEFEVLSWKFGPNQDAGDLRVAMTLREISSAAFDWDAEESDIIGNNTTLPDAGAGLTINNLIASGGGSLQGDGTFINSAILSWDEAANAFVTHYDVEWKKTVDSVYASTTSNTNTIELSPLVDNVEYMFRVRAVTNLGVTGQWATTTLVGGGDVTAPSLPTDIAATGHFKYINITWTNPDDSDLNFVEVYENTTNRTAGATLAGISAGDSFVRANLGLNQTRWYFLRAVDYSGNKSGFTAGVSATTTYLDDDAFADGIYSLFTEQGLYAIEDVTSLPPAGDFTGQKVFNRTDGKLYQWTGSAWKLVIADVAVGSITETKIANDAITTPKLAAGAVTATEIAGNTITGDKIVANTITGGLLATSGIITNSAQINNSVITNAKIENAAITTLKIGTNQVTVPVNSESNIQSYGNGSYQLQCSVTFNLIEVQEILVNWSLQQIYYGTGGYAVKLVVQDVNGTRVLLDTLSDPSIGWISNKADFVAQSYETYVAAGTSYISFWWAGQNSSVSHHASNLSCLGLLR